MGGQGMGGMGQGMGGMDMGQGMDMMSMMMQNMGEGGMFQNLISGLMDMFMGDDMMGMGQGMGQGKPMGGHGKSPMGENGYGKSPMGQGRPDGDRSEKRDMMAMKMMMEMIGFSAEDMPMVMKMKMGQKFEEFSKCEMQVHAYIMNKQKEAGEEDKKDKPKKDKPKKDKNNKNDEE